MGEIVMDPEIMAVMYAAQANVLVPAGAVYALLRMAFLPFFVGRENIAVRRMTLWVCLLISSLWTVFGTVAARWYGQDLLDYAIPVVSGLLCIADVAQLIGSFLKDRGRDADLGEAEALRRLLTQRRNSPG